MVPGQEGVRFEHIPARRGGVWRRAVQLAVAVRTLARISVPDVRALMLTILRRLSAAPSTGSALRSSSYCVPHSYSHATSLQTFHTLESPKNRRTRAGTVLDPPSREGDFFRCLLVLLRQRESLKRDGTFCCRVAAV